MTKVYRDIFDPLWYPEIACPVCGSVNLRIIKRDDDDIDLTVYHCTCCGKEFYRWEAFLEDEE